MAEHAGPLLQPTQEHGWELLTSIRDMLATASEQPSADPEAWAEGMRVFVGSLSATELSTHAHSLLLAAPHTELAANLPHASLKDARANIRYNRKLFMIVRDSLTTAYDGRADERYKDIFVLSRVLGRIATTKGEDPAYISAARIRNARLEGRAISPQPDTDTVGARARMMQFIARIDALEADDYASADAFHTDRKIVRRAVHVAALEAAASQDPQHTRLAVDGIVLNRHYGARKDAMYEAA